MIALIDKAFANQERNSDHGYNCLIWILDTKCNLNCKHCYVQSRGWSKRITKERGLKLINEVKECGFKRIDFTGGEPLLIAELSDYIKTAKMAGLEVTINTNGLLLNEDGLKIIKEFDVFLYVSVDGATKDIYERIRGRNTYELLLSKIDLLRQYKADYSIVFSVSNINYKNAKEMVPFAQVNNARNLCLIPAMPSGEARQWKVFIDSERFTNTISEVQKEAENLAYGIEIWCAPFLKYYIKSPFVKINECPTFELLDISPEGDILVCDVIDNPLSEIRTKSLKEALEEVKNHPLTQTIANRIRICQDCEIVEFCKAGCYSRALIESGNLEKKDPLCPRFSMDIG